MKQGDSIIEIEDLNFGYPHEEELFNRLNFSFKKGQRVGLTGHNGSGKTTFFHLIMGLIKSWSGDIKIFGKSRKDEKDFYEVREKIGLLFQDPDDQLFCPTVEEDIAFGPLNVGRSHDEARAIVKMTCERLNLAGYEKKITSRLSGGEKRLVSFATVIAMNSECYLLDEPTAGLDNEAEGRFLRYLKDYADTYIIITHDREVLKNAVDIVYKIDSRKIIRV
jgi:cobalt/nickel transport system ATP-binding protein